MRTAAADLAAESGEEPIWLCSLRLPDGREYRVSSAAIAVNVRNPGYETVYQYDPFLAGMDEFIEELDVFNLEGIGALTSARIEIVTADNLAALQGDWHAVTAASCEISLIWDGQDYEDRIVVLAGGTVQNVEWGIVGEASRFSIESTPPRSSANVGDDTRDLGAEWPAPLLDGAAAEMSDLTGSKHVWVFGNPDSVPAYKLGAVGGNNRLELSGHRLADLSGVTVYQDGVSVGSFTPAVSTVNGVEYTYVQHATQFASANGAYTWKASNGGIASANSGTVPALGADGVLRKLLAMSQLKVDWRRMEPTFQRLAGWRCGFYTDEQATAIDIIHDSILPYFPLVEMNGGDGIWYEYADPQTAEIEADLILGQSLVSRLGAMASSDLENIANGFTIRYGRNEATNEYAGTVALTEGNSALCYYSRQLYGVREADVIDAPCIWTADEAMRVLLHHASRRCLPRRILTYQPAPELYWLRGGMSVTLTDDDYAISGHRGVITSVRRSGSPQIKIELVDRTPTSRV